MITVDHPHGGGRGKSKGNRIPSSPWGRTLVRWPAPAPAHYTCTDTLGDRPRVVLEHGARTTRTNGSSCLDREPKAVVRARDRRQVSKLDICPARPTLYYFVLFVHTCIIYISATRPRTCQYITLLSKTTDHMQSLLLPCTRWNEPSASCGTQPRCYCGHARWSKSTMSSISSGRIANHDDMWNSGCSLDSLGSSMGSRFGCS
jgi:hypothetical protein